MRVAASCVGALRAARVQPARAVPRAGCASTAAPPALLRVRIRDVAGGREVDALEDALLGSGALSSSTEDADAGSDSEPFYHVPGSPAASGSPWARCLVTALFSDNDAWQAARPAAERALGRSLHDVALDEALDDDWQAAVRQSYQALQVTPRIWVVPQWQSPPDAQALNIMLEPGLAFGTGEHPTTRLCLRWLAESVRGGERVMDYGAGSGILAVASLLLGATRAVATDTDPCAVRSACANAALNGCESRLQSVRCEPCAEDAAPVFQEGTGEGIFDLVVANILLGPLLDLETRLAG